jgi:hypothetical protein
LNHGKLWFQASEQQDEQLWAPAILLREVAAVRSRGQSDPRLALKAVRRLRGSRRQRIHGCDALYVALAPRLGETRVTLDRQPLARRAALIETRQP